MPKTILSQNGYSIDKKQYSLPELSEVKRELMIEPYVERPEFGSAPMPIRIYHETGKRLYMPRYYGLKKFGEPELNKLTGEKMETDRKRMVFNGSLLDRQKQVSEIMKEQITNVGGGCLSVYPGYGKTILALWFACELKVKTAVVCHTTDMMQQWKDRISQFVPNAKIGIVQGKKCVVEDCDFVICSLGTMWRKEFGESLESIGLTIWDEIHLMCTQKFSGAFPKLASKYTLGLSATPYRKDKCEKIFEYFIGEVFHYEKRAKNHKIEARCIVHKMEVLPIEKNYKNDIIYVKTVINICMHPKRIKLIVQEIIESLKENRKLLVLSEYIDHLKELQKQLHANKDYKIMKKSSGLYIGEMKNEDRLESREKDVIFGTYKMASVGMDIPTLNTLFLASPRIDKNNLQQAFGRILREKKLKEGEKPIHPLIKDFIDDHGVFVTQGRKRKKLYKENGYTVVQINMSENGRQISKKVLHDPTKKEKEEKNQKDIGKFLISDDNL